MDLFVGRQYLMTKGNSLLTSNFKVFVSKLELNTKCEIQKMA